jgi:hypothetical protein
VSETLLEVLPEYLSHLSLGLSNPDKILLEKSEFSHTDTGRPSSNFKTAIDPGRYPSCVLVLSLGVYVIMSAEQQKGMVYDMSLQA